MNQTLAQLWGIARYEMMLQWQRRTLLIVTIFFIGVSTVLLFISLGSANQEGLNQTAVTFTFIFTTAPFTFLLMILAIPPIVAEAIPKDAQYGMDELRNSLPLTPTAYLLGKLMGIWLCVTLMMLTIAVINWITFASLVGAIGFIPYLQTWLFDTIPAGLFVASLSVLLASRQPNRKRATMIGGGVALYSFVSFPLGFSTQYSPVQTLLPSAWFSLVMERVMDYAAASSDLPKELVFMSDIPAWFRVQTITATAVQLLLVWFIVWGYWRWRGNNQ